MNGPRRTPAQSRVIALWRQARRVDGMTAGLAAQAVRRYFEVLGLRDPQARELCRAADTLCKQLAVREIARWTA